MNRLHQLRRVQQLPVSLEKAWDFFSAPDNLSKITPDYMGFIVTSGQRDEKMYEGMIISYIVKPLFKIPITWVTEITHVREPYYFVDEQRFGPYSFWHHEHHFREIDGGVEMTDLLNYKLTMGLLGRSVNSLLVRKRVESIFDYRFRKLEMMFGKFPHL